MRIIEYQRFVSKTIQYREKTDEEQRNIALYGLVGELGSLASAIKKQLLAESGDRSWDHPSQEIIEELGDALWYLFAFAEIANKDRPVNIFENDIKELVREITTGDDRAAKIGKILGPKRQQFLDAASAHPTDDEMDFDVYQTRAFLTARTQDQVLLGVCIALLWQLGAELHRPTLPEVEQELNKKVEVRPHNIILGEIAWHLAAISTLFKTSLNTVVKKNVEKVSFRADRGPPTPLHDVHRPPVAQLPRRFEVIFLSVGPGRARMYYNGRQLGDELTDNSYNDDGYRFHDVMGLVD